MSNTAEVTIIVVSYNTRELTLACLRTLFANTRETDFHVVLWDNDSHDGSADAVAAAFPQVQLIRSNENIGFARANNAAAALTRSEWLLLLNSDTETYDGAIDRLVAFAKAHPANGIYGGRTVFPDGSLNIASCWNRITPWSAFCHAVGLTAVFKRTALFDTEAIGSWPRDTVREVDIVVGCFLLIRHELWERLGGFDARYFMYGEEADLCHRAERLGFRPIITPDATIMHLVGAASATQARKLKLVAKARATLMRVYFAPAWRPWGDAMIWTWGFGRYAASHILALSGSEKACARRDTWTEVWRARRDWLSGYF